MGLIASESYRAIEELELKIWKYRVLLKIQYYFSLTHYTLILKTWGRVYKGEKKFLCHLKDAKTNINFSGPLQIAWETHILWDETLKISRTGKTENSSVSVCYRFQHNINLMVFCRHFVSYWFVWAFSFLLVFCLDIEVSNFMF